MLQKNTVTTATLELLSRMMSDEFFSEFMLVGGTALKDLAAMKLNAISINGSRIKDFIDLAYLSSMLTLSEMLDSYSSKYNSNPLVPIKALTFFNDINFQEPIVMMGQSKFSWKVIEKRLLEMQRKPEQLFQPL